MKSRAWDRILQKESKVQFCARGGGVKCRCGLIRLARYPAKVSWVQAECLNECVNGYVHGGDVLVNLF